MPKAAYSEKDLIRIRSSLICTALELMAKQGIQHTTIEQIYKTVGISRTFFYSFFPAKEDIIVEALYLQQLRLIGQILECFGIRADEDTIGIFTNLCLTVMIVRRSIPDTLLLFVPKAADETVAFHINSIVDWLDDEKLYVYVSQEEELAAFTDYFMNHFATK